MGWCEGLCVYIACVRACVRASMAWIARCQSYSEGLWLDEHITVYNFFDNTCIVQVYFQVKMSKH